MYLSWQRREKVVLENVIEVAKGKNYYYSSCRLQNNTADSAELAAHAEKIGADAIAFYSSNIFPSSRSFYSSILE